jgi:hypothetical protein
LLGWLASSVVALWLMWFWAFAPLNYIYDGPVDPKKSLTELTRQRFPIRLVPMSKFGNDEKSIGGWSMCEVAARTGLLLLLTTSVIWATLLARSSQSMKSPGRRPDLE